MADFNIGDFLTKQAADLAGMPADIVNLLGTTVLNAARNVQAVSRNEPIPEPAKEVVKTGTSADLRRRAGVSEEDSALEMLLGLAVPGPAELKSIGIAGAGIIAGRKAKSPAVQAALKAAEQMEASGKRVEEIFQTTGSFISPGDKQRRVHIPDTEAKLKLESPNSTGEYLLSQLLEHPKLFEAYPELASAKISVRQPGGTFYGEYGRDIHTGNQTITVRNNEDMLSTLMHEIQHGVQDIEGFPRGGSASLMSSILSRDTDMDKYIDLSESVKKYGDLWRSTARDLRPKKAVGLNLKGSDIDDWYDSVDSIADKDLQAQFKQILDEIEFKRMDTFGMNEGLAHAVQSDKAYRNLPGEVEARLVETLLKLPAELQFKTHPNELLDVPVSAIKDLRSY